MDSDLADEHVHRALADELAVWLRAARSEKGMSQEDVAFEAGISVNTYGVLEAGSHARPLPNPTLATADFITASITGSAESVWTESVKTLVSGDSYR